MLAAEAELAEIYKRNAINLTLLSLNATQRNGNLASRKCVGY